MNPRTASRNPLLRWQRRTIVGALLGLGLSGLAWLVLHDLLSDPDALPSPIESWLMRLHGLAAFISLFACGLVGAQHVANGWRMRLKRASGALLIGLLALCIFLAYALYYVTSESNRAPVGLLHALVGVLVGVLYLVHRRRGAALA